MKYTCLNLFFIVMCCNTSKGCLSYIEQPQGRFSPQTIMQQLFEMLRVAIRNGSPEEKVPVLDPLVIDFGSIHLPDDQIVRLKVSVTNAFIHGLSSFQLIKADFRKDDTSIQINLNIPMIKIQADYYEMVGNVYGVLPIAGKGSLNIEVHDFNLETLVYLKQSKDGKSILIKKWENTAFLIRQIVSHTQFDNNIDDIVNAFVEDLLASYLNRFSRFICATYSDRLTALVNSFLENFESWRVIAVIL